MTQKHNAKNHPTNNRCTLCPVPEKFKHHILTRAGKVKTASKIADMNNGRSSHLLFSKFFEETKEPFTRFAYTYVKDWDAANDIFMESIMQCWQSYTQSPASITKPYLLSAIRNRSLNYLRDQATHLDIHNALFDHQTREIDLRITTLEACDPSSLFTAEIEQIVKDTLQQMPELTRKIFIMSRYENLSNAEIALRKGLSVKAVEYHMGKALRTMRISLKDYLAILLLLGGEWSRLVN